MSQSLDLTTNDGNCESAFFVQHPRLLALVLILLFLTAIAIRVQQLDAPGLALDREFRSALIARGYYFASATDVPAWRKEIAAISVQRQGVLELPFMEVMVAAIYRFWHSEQLWLARLLPVTFWLIGGSILYRLVMRLASVDAALIATAYYLFTPLGVAVSRSLQPDSLMIMMLLASLLCIVRYHARPTGARFGVVVVSTALTILIRPLVLFALLGAFLVPHLGRPATMGKPDQGRTILFVGLSITPMLLFYGYGLLITEAVDASIPRFLPRLWLMPDYWKDWLLSAVSAVGTTALIGGLLGLPLAYRGWPRALLCGLWGGYVLFGLVFSNHVRFAAYYHAQLIVITALSFAPIATLLIDQIRRRSDSWGWRLPVASALLLLFLLNYRAIRAQVNASTLIEHEAIAAEVGELVNHSSRTVYIASHYGMPLEYYGELAGRYWPRKVTERARASGQAAGQERSVKMRLDAIGFTPEYFVITHFGEFWNHHGDLEAYLIQHECPLIAQSDHYLIYGACPE